ncbi:MAG: Extracytoplasmic solute receptor protein [Thermodesulfobacteriota bacterium]|nr:Extracytoplasmic solute receptor protein [Thermodesulfobacteriota bacterium]
MDWRKLRDRAIVLILVIPALCLLLGAWSTPSASAAAIKMRVQTAAPNVSLSFQSVARFAEAVRVMSDGRLDIEVFPDGAIVPAARIGDAVNTGLVEAGATYAQYFAGKHMAGALFGAPPAGGGSKVGIDQFGHMTWLIFGPGRELHDEYYRDILKMNLVAFPVGFHGPLSVGWFAKPIESLKDLQGRRYRSGPGLVAETWKKIGVPATFLPGGEILPAGQRGVIDGAQWGSPYDDIPLGFHQIWKHYYLQGAHFPISTWELVINKDFWNKLTPDLRKMVEVTARATVLETFYRLLEDNGKMLKEAIEKHGVIVHDVPPDIFDAYMKAADEVLEKYASDPFFKKVLDSQRDYADLIRPYWKASLKSSVFLVEGVKKK